MKKFKKILVIIFGFIVIVGLLVSMGFVNKEQNELLCKRLDISINQENELYFIDNLEVAQFLKSRGDSIVNQPKSTVDVTKIENLLNNYPTISNSEVFVTIDGVVKIKIKQRKPLLRIFNTTGESYYLDDEGTLMPLSDKYTYRTLIANGNINAPYVKFNNYSIKDSVLINKSMLDELYYLAEYISADTFLNVQIQQIYVNEANDIELVPLVGDHRIIFGDTKKMDDKFKKLKIFYHEGLNKTGWWNKYAIINLKYKNQIVCTKKE